MKTAEPFILLKTKFERLSWIFFLEANNEILFYLTDMFTLGEFKF